MATVLNQPDSPMPLGQYMAGLKQLLSGAPHIWVEGELIEFKEIRGNVYGTIRDLNQDVSMSVTVWRSVAAKLSPGIDVGARVTALVNPQLYEKNGRLSLNIQQMNPVGIGDLLARVEMLRKALFAEGLFAPERKRPLPKLPACIGLIAGKDSDAQKDVMRNATLRWPAARFKLIETQVQGPQAPAAVTRALQELDADPQVEVIVIARGGGALEEVILPFSDEALIRAVASAQTPIVSAIGHEADRPILDDVADLRASTPTDAAKRIVPDASEELAMIAEGRQRLAAGVQRLLATEAERLAALRTRPVLANPHTMVQLRAQELAAIRARAFQAADRAVAAGHARIEHLRTQVRSLSPQKTLNRGYAVARTIDGHVLKNPEQAPAGTALQLLLADGALAATSEGTTTSALTDAQPSESKGTDQA
ncbi:exodeoxyribonuclease VII large subunit [Micrococcoides hystricis]|uniref:Exodeoxyribonuclease 7 large subunit n=1 Tax=Micrococcoides hystricis TaxID=1572761 RepID=A0ABV6PAT0_9MICC